MHTHSTHENASSMRGIAYWCRKLGLDGSFITDHDTRIGILKNAANFYDVSLSKKLITEQPEENHWLGWTGTEGSDVSIGNVLGKDAMLLKAIPGAVGSAFFSAQGKRQQVTLMAQVSINLDFCPIDFNPLVHGIMLDISMSERPPDFETAHLCYAAGLCPSMPDNYHVRPMDLKPIWQNIEFRLTEDALGFTDFGDENCFSLLTIKLFCREGAKPFSLAHSRFKLARTLWAQDLLERQKEYAKSIGSYYGIILYAANEISSLGQHKISYSESTPLVDYHRENYPTGASHAINHLKHYDGIYSYCHMFDAFKRENLDEKQRREIMESRFKEMLESRCDGAYLLETGYPEGRAGFSINEHMYVWDKLALNGVFLTGYGNNDSHSCHVGWVKGNNFCAHIFADSVERNSLLTAFKKGRLYSADPVIWRDAEFHMECMGKDMGSIIALKQGDKFNVNIKISLPAGQYTLKVSSHEILLREEVLKHGIHEFNIEGIVKKPVEAVRVMIYNMDGRCIMFSNPIYLVCSTHVKLSKIELPPYRL